MTFDQAKFVSLGHLTTSVPVIVMTGFDKNFICPGWTLCYLLIFDPANAMNQIRQGIEAINQLFLHPPSFIQQAIPGIMDKITPNYLHDQMMTFDSNRSFLFESLGKIKGLKPIYPQGTFYLTLLIELQYFKDIQSDTEFAQKLLKEQNVSAMTVSKFCNEQILHGLRLFTFASSNINQELVERLTNFCQNHYN